MVDALVGQLTLRVEASRPSCGAPRAGAMIACHCRCSSTLPAPPGFRPAFTSTWSTRAGSLVGCGTAGWPARAARPAATCIVGRSPGSKETEHLGQTTRWQSRGDGLMGPNSEGRALVIAGIVLIGLMVRHGAAEWQGNIGTSKFGSDAPESADGYDLCPNRGCARPIAAECGRPSIFELRAHCPTGRSRRVGPPEAPKIRSCWRRQRIRRRPCTPSGGVRDARAGVSPCVVPDLSPHPSGGVDGVGMRALRPSRAGSAPDLLNSPREPRPGRSQHRLWQDGLRTRLGSSYGPRPLLERLARLRRPELGGQ